MCWLLMLLLVDSYAQARPRGAVETEEDDWRVTLDINDETDVPAAVTGGNKVKGHHWDDAAAIFYGKQAECTGVLVAPDVVLTAGHCASGITKVLVGANNTKKASKGEKIKVKDVHKYPQPNKTYDIAALVLEKESTITPRPIALDCILDDYLFDGAEVAIVGFGNTKYNGNGSTNRKYEGYTYVQDHDCSRNKIDGMKTGCNDDVKPDGELGAGGNKVDSCFGDSGGPLYLLTDRGDYLVGITSRGYDGASWSYPCRDGGIYVRPDAVVDWIEQETGRTIERPDCTTYAAPKSMEHIPIVPAMQTLDLPNIGNSNDAEWHRMVGCANTAAPLGSIWLLPLLLIGYRREYQCTTEGH
ncbi:MAG: trypsin-like serine protease [Proteobacteria bacterium]|nr:trypsin-like serine protease [Pseudomonadota bacterium]